MPVSARSAGARPHGAAPGGIGSADRRPLCDNPRVILAGILLLIAALVAAVTVADRSVDLSPDFLTEVVLYALSMAVLTLLVALVFVLARNIVKLFVERRRGLPFARFRTKLVLAMLGMTLVPTVLVLIVGSELIRNSTDRWFSAPIDEVLTSATEIAGDYYAERQAIVGEQAVRIAQFLATVDLRTVNASQVRDLVAPEVTQRRIDMIEVYRLMPDATPRDISPFVDVASPALPPVRSRGSADRLAARAAAGHQETQVIEPLGSNAGKLVRAAAAVKTSDGIVSGVVVASDYLAGDVAEDSRRITEAYEAYNQLRVLKQPLVGVYLSFFLMMTLMILISAAWMGMYMSKRIMRPVQMLADGAREIGAGHFEHRIERETTDEFGGLVDAFNSMAGELAVSRRNLERSRLDLERTNLIVEGRRRYIETILERIATGVVSVGSDGRVITVNAAAARLLGLDRSSTGQLVSHVLGRADLEPLAALVASLKPGSADQVAREVAITQDGREVHMAVAATTLHRDDGTGDGMVVVCDDVTPLIRTQRVAAWRDVARRLAHEIKNPLTPIQLCAERIRRHFTGSAPATSALVDECTDMIVAEVEALKTLVDEFSQFARMPAPRAVPCDLHALLDDALGLYWGLFHEIHIEKAFAPALPSVLIDPEQIRRVIVNLIDNAVEAIRERRFGSSINGEPPGRIVVETQHDRANGVVRVVVADNGPGVSLADREKLFMPYYSTKRRGSGLGLAIVRRVIVEHGGSIQVGENVPRGSRFTVELPC